MSGYQVFRWVVVASVMSFGAPAFAGSFDQVDQTDMDHQVAGDAVIDAPPHDRGQCPGAATEDQLHLQHLHSTGAEFFVPSLVRFLVPPYGEIWGFDARPKERFKSPRHARGDYRAQVFHMTECPEDPAGDRFLGVDYLIALMGHEGVKFYLSETESLDSGPAGIIGADDVIVLKINYQWDQRGGTNVDLLSGVIRRIIDHPDTFRGEIIICENAQFALTDDFDRAQNNAQDIGHSPHDVVMHYQGLGYNISHFDWTDYRGVSVGEYSAGNMMNGYVVYGYNSQFGGRVSYPKFTGDSGTHVSLKYGIWDPDSATYDRSRLKYVNLPVLKSHHAVYGATVCVKNYMGTVTGSLSTNSHNAIADGILGAVLGEIQLADLNILDSIWVNGHPNGGPWTTYAEASRRNELVASVDPVAADIWAVKNILIPAFIANGHSPPWPTPSADPDNPNSAFREYLDNSMEWMLAAGFNVTNDFAQIDTYSWVGIDCNENGIPDEGDIEMGNSSDVNGNSVPDECECLADLDGSGDVGFGDLLNVLDSWGNGAGAPEDLDGDGTVGFGDLLIVLSAWGPCSQ